MKCADIMSKNLEWLNEKDSVQKAAAIMADAGIGFLPICDKWKKVVGVVTDRDLTTRALAKKIAPDASAALVMSSPPITCLDTSDVHEAEQLMMQERKSRIVITDADGNLVGVLSSSDLVNPEPKQWIKGEATVADLMNPDVISLYAEDPAMAAVKEMATRHIHRVVVLDSDSRLAGIVTPMDVVRALARGARFDPGD